MPPSEQEIEFQAYYRHWKRHKDKLSWNGMWKRVYECCLALCKARCVGIYNPHLLERALDAATYCIDLINRGSHPAKLSSFCGLQVNKYLYDKKAQITDRELQLDLVKEKYIETYGEAYELCEDY